MHFYLRFTAFKHAKNVEGLCKKKDQNIQNLELRY
jgi:hypothetical protein